MFNDANTCSQTGLAHPIAQKLSGLTLLSRLLLPSDGQGAIKDEKASRCAV